MRKLWLVARHEFVTSVSKPSFWLMTVIFPLAIIILSLIPQIQGERSIREKSLGDVRQIAAEQAQRLFALPTGYVDEAGIIEAMPPSLPPGWFVAYGTDAAAEAALQAGQIGRYYVIAADYLQSGDVTMVTPSIDPLMASNARELFTFVLNYNLLHDEGRAALLLHPLPRLRTESLVSDRALVDESSPESYSLPMGMMILFIMLLSMSSGFVLNSVALEKENRTVELMLLRVPPRPLIGGKIIAMGAVALLQMAVWLGGLFLSMREGALLSSLSALQLSPSLLLWAALYFFFGYLLYAAEMAALGTLVPSRREAGSVVFLVLLPILVPSWINTALMSAPNGGLALFFSLFPLSAPVVMPMRMVLTDVPLWQLIAAAAGLIVAAWLFIVLAARFFRADTLLSTQALTWRRFRRLWRGEES